MEKQIILGSKGVQIVLDEREQRIANVLEKQTNALGYEVDITTLTTIMKKKSEAKYFELPPADFLPLRVGEGSWSSNLVTYTSADVSGDFETGVLGGKVENGRLASADTSIDALSIKVHNWAKQIGWTIMDLQTASKDGNWDLVTAKETSRKRNWDLGIQKVAFLGMDASTLGLLNQAGVTINVALITKLISSMTAVELKAFVIAVLDAYRTNCNRSAWPTHFTIPESDYLGMAAPSNADFPLKSVMEVLQDTFRVMTKNPNFKVQACAYGDAAYNGLGKTRYALYNSEEESLRMDIPVDYSNTLANSIDNFSFQNVGYGQFTGVKAYRPLEMLYFEF